ncbi:thiolase family protein [Lacisediminimonas profundi]|uniref:thiolase family protein n=1 Tax=Lacisediminimonas profundi TaxID=2603856 RepID=UPI0019D5C558|nr:thiolase family protein [Lacisediminimonas profundi]
MSTAPPCTVMVAGGEVGPFGRFVDISMSALSRPVVDAALRDAGVAASQLQAAYVGNGFGGLIQGQETILGQILLADSGIDTIPIHNLKNACSSGADALAMAWSAIAWGQYECVLVLGVEKMTHADRARPMLALASASDLAPTEPGRSVFMDLNAARAKAYMQEYGATQRDFAMVAVKNRAHAVLNEKAAEREPLTLEQVLNDRIVIDPLTRSMCGGICDGAAALVLVSANYARRHGLTGPTIAASAVVSGKPKGGSGGSATARAGLLAFESAGISPREVSLAEVHDPSAPQELLDIEDLGLCDRGEAAAITARGATALGGSLPVNVSGGLAHRGHPVGATGVAQVVEISRQLTGRAGKSQVMGARVGLAQMAGGLVGKDSAIACVHLLKC